MGLYVEDFEIGRAFRTRGRTVGEGDISAFAGLVGDFTPVHVDEAFARTTPFGGRIAHGPLAMSCAIGLVSQLNLLDTSVIGLLNLTWDFFRPVRIGDTIYAEMIPVESRLTSKPGRGIVKFRIDVLNQAAETVQTGHMTVMMLARGGAGAATE
jgi:acyl dehydratase